MGGYGFHLFLGVVLQRVFDQIRKLLPRYMKRVSDKNIRNMLCAATHSSLSFHGAF